MADLDKGAAGIVTCQPIATPEALIGPRPQNRPRDGHEYDRHARPCGSAVTDSGEWGQATPL